MNDVMKASDENYGKANLSSIEEIIPEKESSLIGDSSFYGQH